MLHAIWTNWVQLLAVDILPFFLCFLVVSFVCILSLMERLIFLMFMSMHL